MAISTERIVSLTERHFDQAGFAASSIDELAAAAGVSTRTLYKHVGSKSALMAAVLDSRHRRFLEYTPAGGVSDLFVGLQQWIDTEGARGCLFLRAAGEAGVATAESTAVVQRYHHDLIDRITRACTADLGAGFDPELVDWILVLFEGATSAATYLGSRAATAAKVVAEQLISTSGRTPQAPAR